MLYCLGQKIKNEVYLPSAKNDIDSKCLQFVKADDHFGALNGSSKKDKLYISH